MTQLEKLIVDLQRGLEYNFRKTIKKELNGWGFTAANSIDGKTIIAVNHFKSKFLRSRRIENFEYLTVEQIKGIFCEMIFDH